MGASRSVITTANTATTAARFLPPRKSLPALRGAARACTACPLWKTGTQTVFGAGSARARVIFVGEQPGHEEDLKGLPFVGPAGQLLDRALVAAGIERTDAYVTNVVKHFKWEPKGKRRLHKRPNQGEIKACLPWLTAEIAAVKPEVLVCLGATAAQALFGRGFKVSQQRGQVLTSDSAPVALATVHPSSILRAPSSEDRRRETELLIDDLKVVARLLARKRAAGG
jgi:uracil-DNA glycosylase